MEYWMPYAEAYLQERDGYTGKFKKVEVYIIGSDAQLYLPGNLAAWSNPFCSMANFRPYSEDNELTDYVMRYAQKIRFNPAVKETDTIKMGLK